MVTIDGINFIYNDYNGNWIANIRGRDSAESALKFWKRIVGDPGGYNAIFRDEIDLETYGKMGHSHYTSMIMVKADHETMHSMAKDILAKSRDVRSRGRFDPKYPGTVILGLDDKIEKEYFEKIIAPSLGGWKQMERDAKAVAEEAKREAAEEAILFDQNILVDVSNWGKGWVAKGKSMRQCGVTLNKNSESLKVDSTAFSMDIPLAMITSIEPDTRQFAKTGDIVIKYGDQGSRGLMVRPGEHLQKFIEAFQNKGHGDKVEESLKNMAPSGGGKRRKTKRRKSSKRKYKRRKSSKRKSSKRKSRRRR